MTTYVDSLGAANNTNPIVLDGNGEASVWLSGYTKFIVYDPNGNLLYTVDNVSSAPAAAATTGSSSLFNTQTGTATYISPTQFSMVGSLATVFPVGSIVRATLSTGDIFGIVNAASVSGTSPQVTTVTVGWFSTPLNATVTSIAASVITPQGNGSPLPAYPLVNITSNYSFTYNDLFKTFNVYSPTVAITLTLPSPTTLPSGSWIEIKNTSVGTATFSGVIEGISGMTLQCGQSVTLHWTGAAGGPIAIWGDDATGTIRMHGTGSVPAGWLVANGATIGSATSGGTAMHQDGAFNLFALLWTYYSETYLKIQTSAGVPVGARSADYTTDWTLNRRMPLPNLGGHMPIGAGNANLGSLFVLGQTGGAETHVQSAAELAAHTHTVAAGVFTGGVGLAYGTGPGTFNPSGAIDSAGSSADMNIMNPFFGVYFIIKL